MDLNQKFPRTGDTGDMGLLPHPNGADCTPYIIYHWQIVGGGGAKGACSLPKKKEEEEFLTLLLFLSIYKWLLHILST